VFLAFHLPLLQSSPKNGAKLPLTIYETVFEGEIAGDGDKLMHIDGEEKLLNIRFREAPYSVETGEAEMISVDFVATTGGNAMIIEVPGSDSQSQANRRDYKISRQDTSTESKATAASSLSPEDEDGK
jgi:COP9 signalosome complex subunit 6